MRLSTGIFPPDRQRSMRTVPESRATEFRRLPAAAGVGFKERHFREILESPGDVGWLEIHAENYMGSGGRPVAQLRRLREDFPFSCHGVGLSIGGDEDLDELHLERLKDLLSWLQPESFSEHLAWSTHDGNYFNDLLPLPYTEETLARVCSHVDQVQETLGRPMLLENPSSYFMFEESTLDELEFISRISETTGCGLLLDINNVHVSATNNQTDPHEYIDNFPYGRVGEIHLGGHEEDEDAENATLLIDNHAAAVAVDVWELYARAVSIAGPLPTLIEWDNDVPDWPVLSSEASKASRILAGQAAAA